MQVLKWLAFEWMAADILEYVADTVGSEGVRHAASYMLNDVDSFDGPLVVVGWVVY